MASASPAAAAAEEEEEAVGGGAAAAVISGIETELDSQGRERMVLKPEGYNTWDWNGIKVNYVAVEPDSSSVQRVRSPPVVLVHGFGASVYHWRYNLPALARAGHRVYAVDLLGFGWTEKALVDYRTSQWQQQLADFVAHIVGEPAVLVGNSFGGYTSLAAAAAHPDKVAGLVLVNSAGRFEEEMAASSSSSSSSSPSSSSSSSSSSSQSASSTMHKGGASSSSGAAGGSSVQSPAAAEGLLQRLKAAALAAVKRVAVFVAFVQARQPNRVRQVLNNVYVADKSGVDDALVESIVIPTGQQNAGEVYYRFVTQPQGPSIDQLLSTLRQQEAPTPMLLLWGVFDPWITPSKAEKLRQRYPAAQRVDVQAGHCPHDEAPEDVNRELLRWLGSLEA